MINYEELVKHLCLVSPMIVLFLVSLIPITAKVLRGNVEQRPLISLLTGLVGLAAALVLLAVFSGSNSTAFNDKLLFDGLTLWTGAIAILASAASLIIMHENPATKGRQYSEYVFLTLNTVVGMLILCSAVDLLLILIGLEMMSLPL